MGNSCVVGKECLFNNLLVFQYLLASYCSTMLNGPVGIHNGIFNMENICEIMLFASKLYYRNYWSARLKVLVFLLQATQYIRSLSIVPENLQIHTKDVIEKKIRVEVERNMACICGVRVPYNGRRSLKGICSVCGNRKSMFV
jgi:hypothetical protein